MTAWLAVAFMLALATMTPQQKPAEPPAETQPASRPSEGRTTLRKPAQSEILRNLLARTDRPTAIAPQTPESPGEVRPGEGGMPPLLLEGTMLVERPGRLIHEEGRARFAFLDGDNRATRTLDLLENQLLELMEREAQAGFNEFVISAEVTRYRDRNYLLVRKLLRRVEHGNLGP